MAGKKIWVNTIVRNEENFIFFALMSVADFVDKILVWDTGSTDKTVEIIEMIKKVKEKKIDFEERGEFDQAGFTKLRQEMLERSNCDWILVLDGDEVWWEDSIKQVIDLVQSEGDYLDGIVVPFYNLIGDVYHYQEQLAGQYQIMGRKGHLQLKLINKKIPGLHVADPHPNECYYNEDDRPIQKSDRLIYLDSPYLHLSHLPRSSRGRNYRKIKYEIGQKFPPVFNYPESFYLKRPHLVPSPWGRMSPTYKLRASLETPAKKFKRLLGKKYD